MYSSSFTSSDLVVSGLITEEHDAPPLRSRIANVCPHASRFSGPPRATNLHVVLKLDDPLCSRASVRCLASRKFPRISSHCFIMVAGVSPAAGVAVILLFALLLASSLFASFLCPFEDWERCPLRIRQVLSVSVSVSCRGVSDDVFMTCFLRCVFERYDAVCHVCCTVRGAAATTASAQRGRDLVDAHASGCHFF